MDQVVLKLRKRDSEDSEEEEDFVVKSFSDCVLGAIVVEDKKEKEKFGNWVSTGDKNNRRFSNIVMALEQKSDLGSHDNDGFDDDEGDAFISTNGGSNHNGFQQDPNVPLDVKVERVSPYGQSFSPPRLRHQHDTKEKDTRNLGRRPSCPVRSTTADAKPEAAGERTVRGLIRRSTHTGTPREGVPRTAKKSWRTLRNLSFSDADGNSIKKFGALKISSDFPHRQKLEKKIEEEKSETDNSEKQSGIPDELVSHLVTLMEELLVRGKVDRVAVIERDSKRLVTSLPEWHLEKADISGLVMAVISTHATMLRMMVNGEMYTCFKHGVNKMVGRAGDNVLVAQTTKCCVVVAHAMDDTPGSALYEADAISNALINHGW